MFLLIQWIPSSLSTDIKLLLDIEHRFPKWMKPNYIYLLIELGLVCMISYALYETYLGYSYIYTSDGSMYTPLDEFNVTLNELCMIEFYEVQRFTFDTYNAPKWLSNILA